MTLVAAWVRTVNPESRELWFAADSRLTGGLIWDTAQKLFPLPRNDSLLAFAGQTIYAYPLITQILAYVSSYERAKSRSLDLPEFKGHIGRMANDMRDVIKESVDGDQMLCELLLGGFDWRASKFRVNALDLRDNGNYEFTGVQRLKKVPLRGGKPGLRYKFFGSTEAVEKANDLMAKIITRNKLYETGLNIEPLKVLIDVINDNSIRDVGGSPQIAKIYPHPNCIPMNVRWNGRVFLYGRRLLEYETNRYLTYCADTDKILSWDELTGHSQQMSTDNLTAPK